MHKSTDFFSRYPIFLLFLGVYPVLYLWLQNFEDVHSFVIGRSILLSAGITILAFLFFLLLLRSVSKSSLLAGLWLLLFFIYGHIFNLIDAATIFGILVGRHLVLIILFLIIGVVGSILILRSQNLFSIIRLINLICTFLLLALVMTFAYKLVDSAAQLNTPARQSGVIAETPPDGFPKRDVYYILLDGYDRPDLMFTDLDLDIRPFLDEIKDLGFVIPACGQSNYVDTAASMAATLNMNYLDELGFTYEELAISNRELKLRRINRNNSVKQKFRDMGYQFISFKTPYLFIDMPDSDIYLDAETDTNVGEKLETIRFQRLFIETTFARTLTEWLEKNPSDSARLPVFIVRIISPESLNPESSTFVGRNYQEYKHNVYQLEKLLTIPAEVSGPKFVYAHVMVTHQPFTFTPTGEFRVEQEDSYTAYMDQVTYVNGVLIEIIHNILDSSTIPPIIILQSDHSFSDGGKRALNFQAYYLPEGGAAGVDDTFSNVNTFRLILDHYFGHDLPLLENRSIEIDEKFAEYFQIIPTSCIDASFR